ncbi:DUF6088 family protein [Mycoplasma sp. 3686d]|uniref:DUF6088 family protein n=1 Tax=Mycoplasma sp. 3686d TaxID=2967300 RepID=UPI00211BCCE6|nr:DUF6088 family protein [Mycoplasma sp. 3686d]UUM24547.1 DUF6088 family protein [Mycoplasma sp. 3686d]
MQKITSTIEKIMIKNSGKIYIAKDFEQKLNINKKTANSILDELAKKGKIVRLIDDLYTKPEYSKLLQKYVNPSVDKVAQKIAKKFNWTIAPGGVATLNYTGISTQVANEYVYISDGKSTVYNYNNWKIQFKHTPSKYIKPHSTGLSILIEAIRISAKWYITIKDIKMWAFYVKRVHINDDLDYASKKLPFWLRDILLKIKEIKELKEDEKFLCLSSKQQRKIISSVIKKNKHGFWTWIGRD